MRDINEINAELKPRSTTPAKKSGQRRKAVQQYKDKPKAPTAPLWASELAETWMSHAEAYGFDPPYNANYLAGAIKDRAAKDPQCKALREEGRETDVHRLIAKMVEVFWKVHNDGFTYVREGDTSRTIKDIFITEVWDDCREYAYHSLRAAYLKEHGRHKPMPEYVPHEEEPYQKTVELRKRAALYEQELETRANPKELKTLDEHARAVLSSMGEKRRSR